ncbi:MAG: cytochrome c oxidase assembly protein [Burkholderiaceae bacterium]|nr:cytochrome c oxidase assembly protein [Burkholderiaceae bacterium]
MFAKLVLLAALMFGFGFALVPIYKAICEVTGIGLLTRKDERAEQFARNTQVDSTRKVVVEFDANSRGPWQFRPERASIEVHPGELVTVVYELVNNEPRAMAGQAIPSYAPVNSAAYFHKVECFCFKQQDLAANEARKFPVVFVVDPKLPADINTITLSYTFFEVGGKTASAAGIGAR